MSLLSKKLTIPLRLLHPDNILNVASMAASDLGLKTLPWTGQGIPTNTYC